MSTIKLTNPNNVKIYTINGATNSRSMPDWLARKNKKKLKYDEEWNKRVELIQEFEFNEASLRVKTTPDGNFAMATGVYKPQIRVYDFAEMSLKFERHTDAENVNFLILSDDWTKSVHLQSDRSLEFHSQSAMHYKTRIPKFGRDLGYHYPSCDLIVCGATNEVYRLNLDQGRFLNPLITSANPNSGINCLDVNPAHQLYAFGFAEPKLEFWDPRSRAKVSTLVPSLINNFNNNYHHQSLEVSKISSDNSGLNLAVGMNDGTVLLYDLRNPKPYITKDHQYGLPIKSIQWLNSSNENSNKKLICSSDSKVVKLWNANDGEHFTSIEPQNDINDCWVVPNSGLIFLANEGIQMQSFYIPSLGPAPRWCSFLDNLTEELEEDKNQTVYEDYKFVTRNELIKLGLDHLIGTSVLRAYMHGFLIDLRLYEKAKLIAEPFNYDDYAQRQIKEKVESSRKTRIQATKALPKVNANLAVKLMEESQKRKSKGKLLQDPRFSQLFNDPEFEVDQDEDEYHKLNPMARVLNKDDNNKQDGDNEEEEEEESKNYKAEEDNSSSEDEENEDSSDEDDLLGWKYRNQMNREPVKPNKRKEKLDQVLNTKGKGKNGNGPFKKKSKSGKH